MKKLLVFMMFFQIVFM